MAHHRRRTWLFTRWTKRGRQQAALDAASAAQEAEREAARRRMLRQATELLPVVRPSRPAPVRETPLLTPGQAARSRRPA
ncbi:hypothetical protein L083_7432 [Actinoplanes sp. N902-109]|nr:hypothetical protein L083_7432 [Actinoplanes sp. N902-109]